jgi:membrane protein DedA with SNARE-associated domain
MQMPIMRFYLYVFLGQLVIGVLLGLIPFFLGRKRGKQSLGNWGLLVTIIAGALSPLGALIAVAVYVWLIVKRSSNTGETTSGE